MRRFCEIKSVGKMGVSLIGSIVRRVGVFE